MTSNSTTMTSDLGYKTTMTLSADFTGKTSGNTREVKAVLSLYFSDSAYGAYAYAPVTYAVKIPGSSASEWAPTRVERSNTYTVTKTAYVPAGQTVSIQGYAYVSWSGADFSYPPNPNNGGSSVSVSLTSEALQSVINTVNGFVLEDSFSVETTKHDSTFTDRLDIKINNEVIKSISDYTSGSAVQLTDSELLNAYAELNGDNKASVTFTLTTMNGSTEVGSDGKTSEGTAKGTARIKTANGWKRGIVWIKTSNNWKRAIIKVNSGGWKRGI